MVKVGMDMLPMRERSDAMIEDKKVTLIRDLKMLEDLVGHCYYGTNCLIHVGRIVDLATNGYYHIGYIAQNETSGDL